MENVSPHPDLRPAFTPFSLDYLQVLEIESEKYFMNYSLDLHSVKCQITHTLINLRLNNK